MENLPKPAKVLRDLEILIGEWEFASPRWPTGQGRMVCEWLEGGTYLIQRYFAPEPAPNSTWIIGVDDAEGALYMLYADSRGMARMYQMSLHDSFWKIWRNATGFSQRFTGNISSDKNIITAEWESSKDGSKWSPDFALIYKKKG